MNFEQSLAAYLQQWAVSAYTDADGNREIQPITLPDPPFFPAVCYTCTSAEEIESGDSFTGLTRADYDFDCWARTFAEAKTLAREVRAGLRAQKRRPQTPLVDGGPIVGGLNNLTPDIPDYSHADKAFVVTVGCTFWHEEDPNV